MAVTSKVYPMFAQSLAKKLVDLSSDSLKVMLLSAYAYADTHQYLSDVKGAGTESTSADYTAGGAALTSVTWARSGDVWTLDAADVSWASAVNAVAAVVYDTTPATDAARPVICRVDLGGTTAVPGIAWAAAGILTATAV